MKFLCITEFVHSDTNKMYTAGTVCTLKEDEANRLIALNNNKPLGALSFFTPIDEDAMTFIKAKKGDETQPVVEGTTTTQEPPSKAELIAEAKNLGIKGADKMNVDELKQTIAAARAGGVTTTPQV